MRYILAVLLGFLLVGGIGVSPAQTPPRPVTLTAIHGPRAVVLDSVLNLRATVDPASTRPVEYLWDLGNGITSEGVVIAHRYDEPGAYTVTLTASNAAGRDTLQADILVTRPAPSLNRLIDSPTAHATSPSSAESPGGNRVTATSTRTEPTASLRARAHAALFARPPNPPSGRGFTWILASDLERDRLQARAVDYVLQGLRVELYKDTTGAGSPAYRLLAGHFSSRREALAARPLLPNNVEHPLLMDLSGGH